MKDTREQAFLKLPCQRRPVATRHLQAPINHGLLARSVDAQTRIALLAAQLGAADRRHEELAVVGIELDLQEADQPLLFTQRLRPPVVDLRRQRGRDRIRVGRVVRALEPDEDGVGVSVDDLVSALLHKCAGELHHLVAAQGARRELIPLRDIPITRNGTIGFQVENAMAAVAAAWGVGLHWETIRRGLASFVNDADNAPGRVNVMDYRGATVIADYGHNPDAMRALVAAVDAMPGKRRSVVISGAGDRRDSDIRDQTVILGDAFDDVILYQDAAQRGRGDGEVMALLREGLAKASRTKRIDEIRGEFVAIDAALERLEPGDLCLVLVDQVEEALAHLSHRISQGGLGN